MYAEFYSRVASGAPSSLAGISRPIGHGVPSLVSVMCCHKTILRPIWTYEIPLWGMASQSNITIIQRFQNKVLRTIVNAPWYIPNRVLHTDLLISTVREGVTKHGTTHKDKLIRHPNQLIPILLEEQGPKRLKRYNPNNLTHRFS